MHCYITITKRFVIDKKSSPPNRPPTGSLSENTEPLVLPKTPGKSESHGKLTRPAPYRLITPRRAKWCSFFGCRTNPPPQYRQHYHKRTCCLYRGAMPGQRAESSGGKYIQCRETKREVKGSTLRNDDSALPIYGHRNPPPNLPPTQEIYFYCKEFLQFNSKKLY